jgi:PAS domain S-box-containing protein
MLMLQKSLPRMSKLHRTVLILDYSHNTSQNDVPEQPSWLQACLLQDLEVTYTVLTKHKNSHHSIALPLSQVDAVLLLLQGDRPLQSICLRSLQQNVGQTQPPMIVIGGNHVELAVQAIKQGAADYLIDDQLTPERLRCAIETAIAEAKSHQPQQVNHQSIAPSPSTSLYQELAEVIPHLVWIADVHGVISYANQRWYDYSQVNQLDMVGVIGINAIHPSDRDRVLVQWQRSASRGASLHLEYRLRRWDGQYHWFVHYGVPLYSKQGHLVGWLSTLTDVNDLKQAEQAINQSEKQIRRVLDSLFSFVGVMTPDGVLIEANRTALVAASLQPEDVLGKPFDQTYWWSYSTEIQTQLQEAIQQAAQGNIVRYDVQVRLGKDQFIIIDFALVPLFDIEGQVEYLIPSGIDITERKQAEAALRDSQIQLQRQLAEIEAIYQSAPIGLNVLDTNLRFVRINQRLAEINGIAVEDHIGCTVRELLPNLADVAEQLLRPILETGEPLLNVEISGETPAQPGVQRTWLEHFLPLKNGDQVIGISTVCEEITDRKRVEMALRDNEAQLRQQAEQLAQANRIKDEFLAVLSHELRTPLNPILGWSKLLQARRLSDEQTQQALMAIERNTRLQMQLIDDLLDISRIIRGKLTLNLVPISLVHLINTAIETVHHAAIAKSIAIETQLDSTIGLVSGDAGRLQQVVWNLLSNAIKFTPEGGRVEVKLSLLPEHSSVAETSKPMTPDHKQTINANTEYAEITITDTGRGISPDFLPHIFEMFRQQDGSTTRQFGGLGLGLAISRQLVEAHGGTITATSLGEGLGSTFTIQLPLMPVAMVAERSIPPSNSTLDLQGLRVLAVDDEPDTLTFLQVLLEQEGAIATTTTSAQQALDLLRQSPVDVIISDIQMPHMDGHVFIRQVRSLPYLQHIPAIALTANAYESNRLQSLAAGYQHYLTKPLDPMVLIRAIAELAVNSAKVAEHH